MNNGWKRADIGLVERSILKITNGKAIATNLIGGEQTGAFCILGGDIIPAGSSLMEAQFACEQELIRLGMLKTMQTKEFIQVIEDAGYEVRSYSGREMYGAQCIGVECGNTLTCAFDIVIAYIKNYNDMEADIDFAFLERLRNNARTDSMGMGQILYFPHLKYEE